MPSTVVLLTLEPTRNVSDGLEYLCIKYEQTIKTAITTLVRHELTYK